MIHGKRYTYVKYKCRCSDCVACQKKYQADYYARNKETLLSKQKEWRLNNPDYEKSRENHSEIIREKNRKRRARKKGAGIYLISQKELNQMYNLPCSYCGSNDDITIDHVMPLSRGGSHSIGNLVSCCRKCNLSKGSKTIMEWKNYGK